MKKARRNLLQSACLHAKRQHVCGAGSKNNNIQKKNEPAKRNTLVLEDSAAAIKQQARGSKEIQMK
jgi:hypothetical protein